MSDEKDPMTDPGRPFDQTNGVVEGLEGESDGSAAGDLDSAGERDLENGSVIESAAVEDDRSGAEDVDDPAT